MTEKTYRVRVPLIQIQGHLPFAGKHDATDRHLREGDIVPSWVPAVEVERLLSVGCLEVQR